MSFTPRPRHLHASDYRVMPWKNGQGTTTEIAIVPAGSSLDDFEWRISIADVGASGPFSAFPGCDRVLVQTEGAPMTLSQQTSGRHTLALLSPHSFAGDEATDGELGATAARDFNAIARRSLARAHLSVLRGAHSLAVAVVHLVHALRGAITVTDGEDAIVLAPGESVLAEEGALLRIRTDAPECVAFLVAIERVTAG